MSTVYEMETMREYDGLVKWVYEQGYDASPRGMLTREVEDATVIVHGIAHALPTGVGRKVNAAIGAAEAVLICGGIASPSLLTAVSDNFRRFVDGGDLHGGYGRRVGPQLERLVERLRRDGDTRQAVISIWDPFYDMQDTRDLPCTLNLGFRIRDGQLNASATMRSNDVYLGTCYDIFTFTQLQWTVANMLQIEPGRFALHAYSLHLYERNFEAALNLHPYDPYEDECLVQPEGFADFQCARDSYNDAGGAAWYTSVLAPYQRLKARENYA